MATKTLFPTQIYSAALKRTGLAVLNQRLADESMALADADAAGQDWSTRNYLGGYTSYGSHCRLHLISPLFAELERAIRPHARRYADALHYDLRQRRLVMTDCWVNIMPPQVMHGSHLHPLSFISGTYYVQTPRNAAPLKFEDPRLGLLMAAPPRRADAPAAKRPFVTYKARAGHLVLFESWLRHEVPASDVKGERISVSFNYAWEDVTKGK
ncbi:TIGR02466 family protein [Ferrovibrio sp. MS7]|uniref:TIGR02466 family protein n=1 Tax=Ferrovibrio plantarum TaxID=3119164 RepID=UPI003134F803